MSKAIDFIKERADREFWHEEFRSTIQISIESMYKQDLIRDYFVSDFVLNGDKVLVKFSKRIVPLTDKELHEKGFFSRQQMWDAVWSARHIYEQEKATPFNRLRDIMKEWLTTFINKLKND